MKVLKHIWFMALKDLKIFSRDRVSVFFYIVFPFLFIILFNFLLRGVGSEDQRLELHLLTREAAGGLSYQIISAIETQNATALPPGQPVIIFDKDYDADRQAVKDKKLAGFIAFPANFTQALLGGTGTNLEVFADASNVNTKAALNSMAGAISSQIGADQVIIKGSVALLVESGTIPNDEESIIKTVQTMMGQLLAGGAEGAERPILPSRRRRWGKCKWKTRPTMSCLAIW